MEGNVRVGLTGDSCEIKVWESLTDKEKEAFLQQKSESEE